MVKAPVPAMSSIEAVILAIAYLVVLILIVKVRFDTEEAADEAARGIVADTVLVLQHAFPEAMRFWWSPREHYPAPAAWVLEHWAKSLKCVFVVRMVGRDFMRVVHSLVQRYNLQVEV